MRREFDVVNAQLKGRKLIEASAGTGKTYSLIHIVARLIVEENIPIERLLLVTFTKAATARPSSRPWSRPSPSPFMRFSTASFPPFLGRRRGPAFSAATC